ncbi:MAG: SCP-2 sterol transfer family protein [Thiogranum sp.]|nr:SCP-2 sterol transfer family protein [Thiogranum sp.]
MAEMFSDEWMNGFKDRWNADPELAGALEKIGFQSTIAYGFEGEDNPRGFLRVENGHAVEAGSWSGQTLNWDLRATPENWKKWMSKPPGMMGLGIAYTSRKLKFNVGDYTAMIKDPRMAGPFIRSFAVMGD